jgi:single-stranded-DNA-specific exonuclease
MPKALAWSSPSIPACVPLPKLKPRASLGLDLIITDHHLARGQRRGAHALAILNPNQPGCAYPEKSLCGAAIALKLAQAVLERRDPARTREKTPAQFSQMAAIATIADAVPLRGENRVIAALGLRELRNPVGAGLRALFAAAALDPAAKQLTGFDVAFRLAPRINAAGRMDVASEVIELFTTRDPPRRRTGRQTRAPQPRAPRHRGRRPHRHRGRLATSAELAAERLLVIDGEGWHRGVIGILASRVVERTAKPAIVISVEDGVAHGSGRSVDGFQLLNAIESCADLFTRFGGHAFAVGFALPAESAARTQAPPRLYAERSTWPRASPSGCCAFTRNCLWIASHPCWPDGCASSSLSATATPSPFSSPAMSACWPRPAS